LKYVFLAVCLLPESDLEKLHPILEIGGFIGLRHVHQGGKEDVLVGGWGCNLDFRQRLV